MCVCMCVAAPEDDTAFWSQGVLAAFSCFPFSCSDTLHETTCKCVLKTLTRGLKEWGLCGRNLLGNFSWLARRLHSLVGLLRAAALPQSRGRVEREEWDRGFHLIDIHGTALEASK